MTLFILLTARAEAACQVEAGSLCACYVALPLDFHPVDAGVRTTSISDADRLSAFSNAALEFILTAGVSWTVTLNPSVVSSTDVDISRIVARDNGVSELIQVASQAAWLALNLPPDALAHTVPQIEESSCTILSADIYYKDVPPKPWDALLLWTEIPTVGLNDWQPTALSFEHIMLHEIAHAAGLGHENGKIALMNTTPVWGGNPGRGDGGVRLNADEQALLSAVYPGAGNPQFLLYAFERYPNPGGRVIEIWTPFAADTDQTWWVNEVWIGADGYGLGAALNPYQQLPPSPPYAVLHSVGGAGAAVNVKYGLTLSNAPGSCATAIEVAHSDLNLLSGVPAYAFPETMKADYFTGAMTAYANSWCVPTGTAVGMYYVCADITNGDGSTADDEIFSDKQFEVIGPSCTAGLAYGCDGVPLPQC